MKQLVQNLKTGQMKLLDVPIPQIGPKKVLVKVHYSLISAGTEAMKVTTARKGYLGKAKEKPEQVKQVIDTLRKEGLQNTYRKVMNKLDSWAPLGYSCSGEVIEIGNEVTEFKIGDRVACAGQDIANHAEFVSVPVNLCVKVPESVSLEDAAYTTLGAIAMQGVRQAELRVAEYCAVIGLGLLGQLTGQILNASGVRSIGIDIQEYPVQVAQESGYYAAFTRQTDGLEEKIFRLTEGQGVDAVIITAATHSLDPVELAGRILRKKGKVIIVGSVPTGFSRENYYKKELELRMSTSYGPGRYDPQYEDKGIDYPYAYVRWTEKRNMQGFLQLLEDHKISLKFLTTHHFKIEEAIKAYEFILNRSENFLGIILHYPVSKEKPKLNMIHVSPPKKNNKLNIGFIGAGSFAQSFLIPNILNHKDASLIGVATTNGHTARSVADRFSFNYCTTDYSEILSDDQIDTVFIATRHDSHGKMVLEALKAGKNVFVEKPLAINQEEIYQIKKYFETEKNNSKPYLMVGYNRRFAPFSEEIKNQLANFNVAIDYRINAGYIPSSHWIQDPKVGGGRIIGEVCHFIDLAIFFCDSLVKSLHAVEMETAEGLKDVLTINLKFINGSIASISYFSNGNKSMGKERIEIFSEGTTYIIDDFKQLQIWGKKLKKKKLLNQDKGHKNEVQTFLNQILENGEWLIPYEQLMQSSLIPFKVLESLQTNQAITIDE